MAPFIQISYLLLSTNNIGYLREYIGIKVTAAANKEYIKNCIAITSSQQEKWEVGVLAKTRLGWYFSVCAMYCNTSQPSIFSRAMEAKSLTPNITLQQVTKKPI